MSLGQDDWRLLSNTQTRAAFFSKAVKFLGEEAGEHWTCRFTEIVKVVFLSIQK
jgi:hypothetical protein